jgi:putative membrane protein
LASSFFQTTKKTMKHALQLATLVLAALLVSCGNNNSSTATADSTSTTMAAPMDTTPMNQPANTMTDQDFVTQASAANAAEIAAHKAAQTHAKSADVKTHAKKMLADHEKLGTEMKSLASAKGWTLSDGPAPDQQQQLDNMNNMSGADWDKAYTGSQLQAHQDAVSLFEMGSSSVQDIDLKALIDKTLPTLREHLQMVQDMQAKMNQ